MSAFNARIRPKEIGGVPAYAVGGFLLCIPTVVMGILIPITIIKVLFFLGGFILFTFGILFLVLGDEIAFMKTIYLSHKENNCVTVETWTHE